MFPTREPQPSPLDDPSITFAELAKQAVDPARIWKDVERLPAPRNRLHAATAMDEADRILVESFSAAGWMAGLSGFDIRNVRGVLDYAEGRYPAGAKPIIYPRLIGANILALKPGVESTDVVVVGAHHDTIRDSPGADDNTASVAALLELARLLGPYSFRDTVLLAVFDMEELNMFGSRELVRLLAPQRRVRSAIIFETMAYGSKLPGTQKVPKALAHFYPEQAEKIRKREFRGDWTAVIYNNSALDMATAFGSALAHVAGPDAAILFRDLSDLPMIGGLLRLLPGIRHLSRSDHLSFWKAGIPAILITDTADFRNPNYHQPTDTPDTLDYERIATIVQATAITVAKLAGHHPAQTAAL